MYYCGWELAVILTLLLIIYIFFNQIKGQKAKIEKTKNLTQLHNNRNAFPLYIILNTYTIYVNIIYIYTHTVSFF